MSQSVVPDPVSLLPDLDALRGKTRVVRKLSIPNFKEELQRLGALHDWEELTIYADDVVLDLTQHKRFGFDLTNRTRFTLLTRRLTIRGNGSFVLLTASPGGDTVAEIAVQEFVGRPIAFATAAGTKNISIPATPPPKGQPVRIETRVALESSVVSASLARERLGWEIGSQFYWSLVNTFQHGFARIDTDRDEARRTFLWVYENTRDPSWWGGANAEMISMAAQSLAMVSRLSRTPPPWPVPIRDLRALKAMIETRMDAAQRLESSYETFVDRKLSAKERTAAMKRAITESKAQQAETERQLASTQQEIEKAEATATDDLDRVRDQQKKVQDAALAFETGKRIKELIDTAKAIGELGASLAALAGGAPPATMTSFKFIIPDKPGKLDRLISALEKVGDPIKKLAKIVTVLKDAYKVGSSIKDMFNPNRKLETFKDDEGATKLTDTDWKVLREAFDATLRPYTSGSDKVDGASEYLEAGRVLVIYGEAMYATRLNITRLQERIINLKMKKTMHEQHQQRLAKYEGEEALSEEAFREAELLLRQRYLDVKRALLFDLEDFGDAYRYWALREPAVRRARLQSRVAEMAELKVELPDTIDAGLAGLFPQKQQRVVCHIVYEPTLQEIQTLAQGESIVVQVRQEAGLKGWSRVRIDDLQRVELEGLSDQQSNLSKNYRCHVRSSGGFVETWNGTRFEFAAPATQEFSHSRLVEGSKPDRSIKKNTILTVEGGPSGGDLGQFSNMPYYLPGLFSDWSISLPKQLSDNASLDLSKLKSIKVSFSAWAMSDGVSGRGRKGG